MRLPNPLAAWWRDMAEGVRLMPSMIRELLGGGFLQLLVDRARANAEFWEAHEGAAWGMLLAAVLSWVIVLGVLLVFT